MVKSGFEWDISNVLLWEWPKGAAAYITGIVEHLFKPLHVHTCSDIYWMKVNEMQPARERKRNKSFYDALLKCSFWYCTSFLNKITVDFCEDQSTHSQIKKQNKQTNKPHTKIIITDILKASPFFFCLYKLPSYLLRQGARRRYF